MPRNTRNFWVTADIDGRETTLEGGPQSRDGGFSALICIRDDGGIAQAVTIRGCARGDGTLTLTASPASDVAKRTRRDGKGFTVTTRRDPAARPGRRPRTPRVPRVPREPAGPTSDAMRSYAAIEEEFGGSWANTLHP